MSAATPESGPAASSNRRPVLPAAWQFLPSPPADGLTNMAVDRVLLQRAAGAKSGVWRCYAWERPTVSFGRHEQVRERFTPASVAAAGLDAVRRPTGGRALLHHREVTYSATFPLDADVPWRAAYAAVNAIILTALRSLGVPAELVSRHGAVSARPDGPVCFDEPAEGEITVRGRKLVGSAVWRDRGAYLQHGSILLHDDQAWLARAAVGELPAPPPAASLHDVGDAALTWQGVTEALQHALSHAGDVLPFLAPDAFAAQVATARADDARDAWLWRR